MHTLGLTSVFRWLNVDVYWRRRDAPDPGAVLDVQVGDIVAWRGCDARVERLTDQAGVRTVLLRRWKEAEFPVTLVFPPGRTHRLSWPEVEAAYAAGEWQLPQRAAGRFQDYPPNLLRVYPLADPAGGPRQSALRDPGIADPGAPSVLERLIGQLEQSAAMLDRDGVEAGLRSIEAVGFSLAPASERAALTRMAEARLEFGLACQALGEHSRAIDFFVQAARDYRLGADPHGEAVARWMAGEGQRATPSTRRDESLVHGQTAADLFYRLVEESNRRSRAEALWYRARLPLLYDCLTDAAQPAAGGAAPRGAAVPAAPAVEPTQPASPTRAPETAPAAPASAPEPSLAGTLMELAIPRLFKKNARVSANANGELAGPPASLKNFVVHVDHLLIDGRPYRLHDLSSRRAERAAPKNVMRLDLGKDLLLPVAGDSMNAATPQPIDDGDYVVCRPAPNPGDHIYVIALLSGEKGQETGRYVVKYRERGQLLSLTRAPGDPDDPADPYRPIKLGPRVKLVGRVLAVLKPLA